MIYLQIFTMIVIGMSPFLLMVYLTDKIIHADIANDCFVALLATFTILLCIAAGVLLEIFLYQRWLA